MVLGVPLPVLMFLILSLVLGLVLGATVYGRQIYQIGTNEVAARHAGIRTTRIKIVPVPAHGACQRHCRAA